MRRIHRLIFLALAWLPLSVAASPPVSQHLFKIERNKNANIVQYDVRVNPDGTLYRPEPVVAYWVRLAEQGQVKPLSWLQKTFAYGFDASVDESGTSATLEMVADFGKKISIVRHQSVYRAAVEIDGQPAVLKTIFVHATGKGLSTRVHFIELNGFTIDGNAKAYERIED